MICARCDHFCAKALTEASVAPVKENVNKVGICRRYPPRMIRQPSGLVISTFPNVHRDHACGEFHDSRAIPC